MFETESINKDPLIKIIDFGLAKRFEKPNVVGPAPLNGFNSTDCLYSKIGTPYYIAPEVIAGSYDQSCDLWSIGVITYCLLAGHPPFMEESDALLFRKISLCDYEFSSDKWSGISKEARLFIQGLL